jgi:tol-pal system protein YbgF
MRYQSIILLALVAVLSLTVGASGGNDKEKDQLKLAVDDLKNEVTILERQVNNMQQSMDRNSGQMSALITQISDTVNSIRSAQSRANQGSESAISAANATSEQIGAANQKIDKLSAQLEQLRHLVETLPKLPAFSSITPGNPDQLFAAGIADYYRGNYDLAMDEFKQFIDTYGSSQLACSAQFWIGECLSAKGKNSEAVQSYDQVALTCEKAPAAHYKKAKALQQLGQSDEARKELEFILKKYPRSNEAELARREPTQ